MVQRLSSTLLVPSARPERACPRVHVAVVLPAYARAILAGVKTIESRLSRVRCEPFGRVGPGDEIYFRAAGRYVANATITRVLTCEHLTPAGIDDLRSRYARAVAAPLSYWRAKRASRHATLVWLDRVAATDSGPSIPRLHGRGWVSLEHAG